MTARHPGLHYDAKRGLWVATVDLPRGPNGERRRLRRTSRHQGRAERLLVEMRAEAVAGTITTTGSPTVQEWLTWWLQHVAATRLKPSTYANYRSAIHRTLIPSLGHLRLDRLTTDDVEKMHAFVTSRGAGAATARYAHAALRKALHDAVARGRIRQNPAALIEAPPPQRTTRTALTVAEAQRILEVTAEDRLAARWALALVLGVRRGEAIGLALDSVETDRVHISWQLQRLRMKHGCSPRPRADGTWPCGLRRPGACPQTTAEIHSPELESRHLEGGLHLIRPKSRAGWRTLPLPAGLAELVERRVEAANREPNPHGLLFTRDNEDGPLTGRPIEPKLDTEAWQGVAERAGITRAGTLHEARHTTATLLQSLGVEESLRVEILGHSSITTTRNYQHADISLRSAALGRLSSMLGLAAPPVPEPPKPQPAHTPRASDPDLIALTAGWQGDADSTLEALARLSEWGVQSVVVLGGLGAMRPGRHGRRFDHAIDSFIAEHDLDIVLIDGPGDPLPRYHQLPADAGWRHVLPRLRWAPRGHTWTWGTTTFLALGGGHGSGGVTGITRWPEHESLTEDDLRRLPAGPTDVLLTATAPASTSPTGRLVSRAIDRLAPRRVIHPGNLPPTGMLWDVATRAPIDV